MNQQTQAVATRAEKDMEFIPYGAQDKIKLNISIVQNFIAVPTKSGKTCSVRDAVKFLMLCQAQRLNPFTGDAFLLGYDSRDGVATFSLITAHQAYLKRAELHPEFDGMESGIIVQVEDEKLTELKGDFHMPDQTVVGGWATVYFKTRKIPITRKVRLSRFQKPYGVWQDDPAGMICKCAEADALRSSFPTLLGGLYMKEEINLSSGEPMAHDIPSRVLVDIAPAEQVTRTNGPEREPDDLNYRDGTAQVPKPSGASRVELCGMVEGAGFTFDQFRAFAGEGNLIKDADSLTGWDDVTEADAKRLLRAKAGLLGALTKLHGTTGAPASEGQML